MKPLFTPARCREIFDLPQDEITYVVTFDDFLKALLGGIKRDRLTRAEMFSLTIEVSKLLQSYKDLKVSVEYPSRVVLEDIHAEVYRKLQ